MIRHVVLEIVTPAMIGGAQARECDYPPTLRPPSLRGQLRFWSRALGGEELEVKLWGDEERGQRVRILGALSKGQNWRGGKLADPVNAQLLRQSEGHGRTVTSMVPPGDEVCLRLGIPRDVELDALRAVFWIWLHLGAVGRRSRRGYGSVQWLPSEGDLFADSDWPPLWSARDLRDPDSLTGYLREGLAQARKALGVPGDGPRSDADAHRLMSVDQVFVGRPLVGSWEASGGARAAGGENLEQLVHGYNERARGGQGSEPQQLGSANPRLPSPMLWRCFRRHDGQAFIPVMTWFPYNYSGSSVPRLTAGGGVYRYLHDDLGFDVSLTGGKLAA